MHRIRILSGLLLAHWSVFGPPQPKTIRDVLAVDAHPLELKATLVQVSEVQEELALNDDQKASLHRLLTPITEQSHRLRYELTHSGLSPEDRFRQSREASMKRRELHENAEKALKTTMAPGQYERFSQIVLQVRRGFALLANDTADKLKLTTEQRERLRAIDLKLSDDISDLAQEQVKVRMKDREPEAQTVVRGRHLRETASSAMLAILTPTQDEDWKKMLGSKFEFAEEKPVHPGPRSCR